jgi:hypothetical protein
MIGIETMSRNDNVNFNRIMAGLEEVANLVEGAAAADPLRPSGPPPPEGQGNRICVKEPLAPRLAIDSEVLL